MAPKVKAQRTHVDRSETHYPKKGPNARLRCNSCIEKKKGCFTRLGNDKCDLCIEKHQECVVSQEKAAAHGERERKKTGLVIPAATASLNQPRVPAQSSFPAPDSPASDKTLEEEDEDKDGHDHDHDHFQGNSDRDQRLKSWPSTVLEAHPALKGTTEDEATEHSEKLDRMQERELRDNMDDYANEPLPDPSYFELSDDDDQADMGDYANQPLPHPDHFAIDLEDEVAAIWKVGAVQEQHFGLDGSAGGPRAHKRHFGQHAFGSDGSDEVAFNHSGNSSEFERSEAFSHNSAEQQADFGGFLGYAKPVDHNAAGLPIMDQQHAEMLGWEPVQGFTDETPVGETAVNNTAAGDNPGPVRSPKGKGRETDVIFVEDSEGAPPGDEHTGAPFYGNNNTSERSIIPGASVIDAQDEQVNAGIYEPLMVYQEPSSQNQADSEPDSAAPSIPIEPKFSNGPLQPILCCNQVKMQVYTPTFNKTEKEHNAIGAFITKLIGKAPAAVAHGPVFPGSNVWEDYLYLFATVSTDTKKASTFRLFGTNDEIEGPDAKNEISYTEIFINERPQMICQADDDGVGEFLIRSYGLDFNCKLHTNFSPCYAYLVRYQPKRGKKKVAPRQGAERCGSAIPRNARNRRRR